MDPSSGPKFCGRKCQTSLDPLYDLLFASLPFGLEQIAGRERTQPLNQRVKDLLDLNKPTWIKLSIWRLGAQVHFIQTERLNINRVTGFTQNNVNQFTGAVESPVTLEAGSRGGGRTMANVVIDVRGVQNGHGEVATCPREGRGYGSRAVTTASPEQDQGPTPPRNPDRYPNPKTRTPRPDRRGRTRNPDPKPYMYKYL